MIEKPSTELLDEIRKLGPYREYYSLIPTEKSHDELRSQKLRNEISRENPELELLT